MTNSQEDVSDDYKSLWLVPHLPKQVLPAALWPRPGTPRPFAMTFFSQKESAGSWAFLEPFDRTPVVIGAGSGTASVLGFHFLETRNSWGDCLVWWLLQEDS